MAGETKLIYGTPQTGIISIAANIASNFVAGNNVAYDNTIGYPYGLLELSVGGTFAAAPTANTWLSFWGVPLLNDGTSFATQGGSVTAIPAAESGFASTNGALPLGRIFLANSTSAFTQELLISTMIIRKMKVFFKNESLQTINANTGTELAVSITPVSLVPA